MGKPETPTSPREVVSGRKNPSQEPSRGKQAACWDLADSAMPGQPGGEPGDFVLWKETKPFGLAPLPQGIKPWEKTAAQFGTFWNHWHSLQQGFIGVRLGTRPEEIQHGGPSRAVRGIGKAAMN